jgi:ribosome-binding protein aMBF1 (putative translation factor)
MFLTATADLPGDMDFAHRLAATRKQRGLTQQALAERVGIHVSQIRLMRQVTPSPPWTRCATWPWRCQ